MHLLFTNRSILSNILTHLNDDSLASHATISKDFHEAALAVVWRDVTPTKILTLFPEGMLGVGNADTLELNVPIADYLWSRIYMRTQHVRILTYARSRKGELQCFLALLLCKRTPLFSHLSEVNFQVQSWEELLVLCLVIPECLTVFRCTLFLYELADELHTHTPLIQLGAVLKSCDALRDVDIHCYLPQADDTITECMRYAAPVFPLFDRFLVTLLAGNRSIKTFRILDVPYSAQLFKSLVRLPSLEHLEWKLQQDPGTMRASRAPLSLLDIELENNVPFPALKSWHLNLNLDSVNDVHPEGWVMTFFDFCAYSPVCSIRLAWIASKEFVKDVVERIADTWPKLQHVSLQISPALGMTHMHVHHASSSGKDDADPPAWDRLTWACFHPLLKCTDLQVVVLLAFENYSISVRDKDVSEMKAWPALKELKIVQENEPCSCQRSQVTVMGLIALLLTCQRLQTVAMAIDLNPVVHPQLLQAWSSVLAASSLRHLKIGNSRIDNPRTVATLLHTIAPKVKKLEYAPFRSPTAEMFEPATDEEINRGMRNIELEIERIKSVTAANELLRTLRNAKPLAGKR